MVKTIKMPTAAGVWERYEEKEQSKPRKKKGPRRYINRSKYTPGKQCKQEEGDKRELGKENQIGSQETSPEGNQ